MLRGSTASSTLIVGRFEAVMANFSEFFEVTPEQISSIFDVLEKNKVLEADKAREG